MIDWIKNIFNNAESGEIQQWVTDASILSFLNQHIKADGSLKDSAIDLPDEKKGDNELKFAPGLADSMFGADDSVQAQKRVKALTRLIVKISQHGYEQSKSDFYREITENEGVIGIIDEFLQALVQSAPPIEPHLFEYANSLATKTSHRNAVKFGIAILGLCQSKKPINDIKTLGLHDEFTVFSTIALSNLSDNIVIDLWELGKKVDGWGKIQLVDRLSQMELSDEIRNWLITDGYKNNIMYEYLALTCAINGRLNRKLSNDSINPSLLRSAGEIIVAMIDEGPAEGMSAYSDSVETIQNFLRHAENQELEVTDFIVLNRIKDYLETSNEENESLKKWNQNELSDSLIDINEILTSKDWTTPIRTALRSTDKEEYWNGKLGAEILSMDISDFLWKRLDDYPLDSSSWYDVTARIKSVNPQKVVTKAISLLPLNAISTGPENSMGIGPDYEKHQSLDFVITFLENHPKIGEELLLYGLKSPVIRNRNMTLRTLEKWTSANWSDTIKSELINLKEIEPYSDTKEMLIQLLNESNIE